MPRYRLLAIDVDGTLVNSRDELTAATCAALRRAEDAGMRIALATGRRYSRCLSFARQLELDAPLVTASGALVKRPTDHATLHEATFDRDVLAAWISIVADAGYEAVLYGDTFSEGFDFYCRGTDVDRAELAEFFALNEGLHRDSPRMVAEPPHGIFAGFAMASQDEMLRLEAELQRALPDQLETHVIRSPRYRGYMCEIAAHGVTKWSGIRQLADEWGIADEAICAVGDDVNDLPMIRAAGLGIAMGNALDEVKDAADRIAPTHDDEGLVEIVEWLLG